MSNETKDSLHKNIMAFYKRFESVALNHMVYYEAESVSSVLRLSPWITAMMSANNYIEIGDETYINQHALVACISASTIPNRRETLTYIIQVIMPSQNWQLIEKKLDHFDEITARVRDCHEPNKKTLH